MFQYMAADNHVVSIEINRSNFSGKFYTQRFHLASQGYRHIESFTRPGLKLRQVPAGTDAVFKHTVRFTDMPLHFSGPPPGNEGKTPKAQPAMYGVMVFFPAFGLVGEQRFL